MDKQNSTNKQSKAARYEEYLNSTRCHTPRGVRATNQVAAGRGVPVFFVTRSDFFQFETGLDR